jgi:ubiquinone/menaquinone biosynthesis C-methylase UbiE
MAPSSDPTAREYFLEHRSYWDSIARRLDSLRSWNGYYRDRLKQIYAGLIPAGSSVLELGCHQGDLLAAVQPSFGVGVDFSSAMVRRAKRRHPQLHFVQADVHAIPGATPFDYIILSDLLNDAWDVQTVFRQISRLSAPRTRIILNTYSRVWEPLLALVRRLGLTQPVMPGNWLTGEDIVNFAGLEDQEVFRQWQEILFPLPIPLLADFCNKFLVRFWPFRLFALSNLFVARPRPVRNAGAEYFVSVVIPARNEEGNISKIFNQVPEMGKGTELIFVEGHSRDYTLDVIRREMQNHPGRKAQLHAQKGIGKGDAVREAFPHARGEVLMILDADLTVSPNELPRFYEALVAGKGELVNGVRLVYPMERQAMQFLNLAGNKFFSLALSWLLGQPIKDTLCGTKVLWKSDYDKIAAHRAYFGELDPFGDFDLIYGAVKLNRRIVDLPIRYRERTYGATNIRRWSHGWLLMKMLIVAARKIKFV